MTSHATEHPKADVATTYWSRNQRWLSPFLVIATIATSQLLLQVILAGDAPDGKPLPVPGWSVLLSATGCALGAVCSGIFAFMTDTLSAAIARVVLPGLALGLALSCLPVASWTILLCILLMMAVIGVVERRRRG